MGRHFNLGPAGGGFEINVGQVDNPRLFEAHNASYTTEMELDITLGYIQYHAPVTGLNDNLRACGGYADRFYGSGYLEPPIWEINPDTLAVITTRNRQEDNNNGIGGTLTELFVSSRRSDNLYEINPTTLADIRSGASPSGFGYDIGGLDAAATLYLVDGSGDLLMTVNSATFALINSYAGKSTGPAGFGGVGDRLYHTDIDSNNIYELNESNMAILATASSNGDATGVGGFHAYSYELLIADLVDGLPAAQVSKIQYDGAEYV